MGNLSKFIITKVMGWKVIDPFPVIPKCVLAIAPHTSNWDFVVGKLAYNSLGRQANFLIKAEWFFFPFNIIFSSMGGIPVKRDRNDSLTNKLAEEFKVRKWMHLGITPEGTRSWVPKWRKGFYHMAIAAKVPIIVAAGDFRTKQIHLGYEISVKDLETRSFEDIMQEMEEYYKKITPKYPEKWNPKIY